MNTRRARKRAISKAMRKAYVQPVAEDLSKAQLQRRVAELERQLRAKEMENAALQQENIKKESKIQHFSSQVKSLNVEVTSFKSLTKQLQERYSKVVEETGYQKFGHFGNMADYLEGAKPQLIDRFLQRMHNISGWKPEWDAEVRKSMLTWSYQEIDLFMDDNQLQDLYYESDAASSQSTFTAEEIYEHIMQFEPNNESGTDISTPE